MCYGLIIKVRGGEIKDIWGKLKRGKMKWVLGD